MEAILACAAWREKRHITFYVGRADTATRVRLGSIHVALSPNVAFAARLMRHARDEHDGPPFLVKGGVAVELLLGFRAARTQITWPHYHPYGSQYSHMDARRSG